MTRRIRLLEVFREHKPIIEGASQHGRYKALYELVPRENRKPVTLDQLRDYVSRLQERYPDRNFYLREEEVDGKRYYVITRKSYTVTGDGRRKRVHDRIPIYVDLENQRFYVPATYARKQKRLTNYVLMRVLGALGVSRTKYIATIGPGP